MPHYKTWQGVADTLDGSMDVSRVEPVIPADAAYWAKS